MYEGKWINVCTKSVLSRTGKSTTWEFVERKQSHEQGDSVDVVAFYKTSIILIACYRYPVQSYILEFPAGLTEGDSIESAALKELKEETGFLAYPENVQESSPVLHTDPWKSTETTRLVVIEVPEIPENENPVQDLEDEEVIIVELVPISNLCQNIVALAGAKGYGIDARLYLFAKGFQESQEMQSPS